MHVLSIFLAGILISLILNHFNLPFYFGIPIVFLGLLFLFSSHRGFTHSFLGIILQSVAISLLLFLAYPLLLKFNWFNNNFEAISIILVFISVLFVNKKILIFIFILIMLAILKFNTFNFSFINFLNPTLLGLFSHIILDSFTPYGISPFIPFSNKKVYKNFGILMLVSLIFIVCLFYFVDFNLFFEI